MKLLGLILTVFLTQTATASLTQLFDIKSEIDGDETAYMMLEEGAGHAFMNLQYKKPGQVRTFSIDSLNKSKQAIVTKGPVDVVSLSVNSSSATSMTLNIHYLYQYNIVGSDRRVKKLKVSFNAPANRIMTIDVDSGREIRHAYVYVRTEGGKEKGIDRIETW